MRLTASRYVSVSCLVASIATGSILVSACSPSATSSTNTTSTSKPPKSAPPSAVPPPPPNAAAISQYLQAPRNAVTAFERATTSLGSGSTPSKGTCQSVAQALNSSSATNPNAVLAAAKGIANPAIQVSVNEDVQAKLSLLSSCLRGSTTHRLVAGASTTSATVQHEFQQLGVSF